ncbi:MAG: YDG domain-containing protein [Chitinispirillales bacterium]|nr:YDG domain-containing protein [Chitinispirillales bacterium]
MKSVKMGVKKKIAMAAFAVAVVAGGVSAQTWNIGVNADRTDVTATLIGKTLIIEGTGDMGYDRGPPWGNNYNVMRDIEIVIIKDGVTSIGDWAFANLENLISVTIPNTVTSIENYAFASSISLTSIIIPKSVARIDDGVFDGSTSLDRVDFLRREPMESIGLGVFGYTSPSLRVYGFSENTTISTYPDITFVPYHGLSLSRSGEYTYNSIRYGNTPQWTSATLRNTNYPLSVLSVVLSGANASAFTLDLSALSSVGLGENASFRITPQSGLTPGTYTATITVSVAPSAGGETDWINPRTFNVNITVNPRLVTITGLTAFNKEYDGTTTALPRGSALINGIIDGDNISMVEGTASFADPSAGNDKTVTFSGFSLAGLDVNNYTLSSQPSSVIANINPRVITITGVSAVDRNADGTTSVGLTGGTLVGVISGDLVGFVLGNGTMASPDAGTDKPVTTNIVLIGSDAPNYQLAQPGNVRVNIGTTSIADIDREIPVVDPDEAAVIVVPANQSSGEFTVGPNPIDRLSGVVNFYRQGRRVNEAVLTIFDAFGNVVNRIGIADVGTDFTQSRVVGSWDLTDTGGRPVSAGTYLLRGTVATADGNRERVSMVLGIR